MVGTDVVLALHHGSLRVVTSATKRRQPRELVALDAVGRAELQRSALAAAIACYRCAIGPWFRKPQDPVRLSPRHRSAAIAALGSNHRPRSQLILVALLDFTQMRPSTALMRPADTIQLSSPAADHAPKVGSRSQRSRVAARGCRLAARGCRKPKRLQKKKCVCRLAQSRQVATRGEGGEAQRRRRKVRRGEARGGGRSGCVFSARRCGCRSTLYHLRLTAQ